MLIKEEDITIVIDNLGYHKRIMLAIRMLLCLKPLVVFKDSELKFLNARQDVPRRETSSRRITK